MSHILKLITLILSYYFQVISVSVGLVVVAITAAVLAKFFFSGRKKPAVTLREPDVKYPLKLIDKVVRLDFEFVVTTISFFKY